jgi:hypothetical protein
MIYKLLVIWGLLIGCLVGAKGQLSTTLAGGSGVSTAAFTGPGDIVSGADAWWGLRAYSAADRGNKLINVCNVSDVACVDMSSDATTGKLVITTVGGSSCSSITCTIKTFYDRSGSTRCTTACDMTTATIANRATLLVSCLSSLPCAQFNGSQSYQTNPITTRSQPWTFSAVMNRTGTFTSTNGVISEAGNFSLMGFFSTTNTGYFNAGNNNITPTINDSSPHAMQGVGNGASSATYTDGTQTTGNAGVGTISSSLRVGATGNGLNKLTGNIHEVGAWSVGFTSTQAGNMNTNQHNFWGF